MGKAERTPGIKGEAQAQGLALMCGQQVTCGPFIEVPAQGTSTAPHPGQMPVDPSGRRIGGKCLDQGQSGRTAACAKRVFHNASSHSPEGVDPMTIPPPTLSVISSPLIDNVRIATEKSALPSGPIQPTAPQ